MDRVRQIATNLGIRPYRVFLTWTKWGGEEIGEGDETLVQRIELLPTPRVRSLDNITLAPFHAGILPEGSLRVDQISTTYTLDQLMGRMQPVAHEDHIPEPYDFFYEVVEDGRGDPSPVRMRFRLFGTPHRLPDSVQWQLVLQRTSEDRTRDDKSAFGTGQEG